MKRFVITCLVVFNPWLIMPVPSVNAGCEDQACPEAKPEDTDLHNIYQQCLNNKKICLEDLISQAQTQKTTLTNTINILSGQIGIQRIQISQTQAEIAKLENEINILSGRIKTLNFSLDKLTDMLINRVVTQYKRRYISSLSILAQNKSVGELFAHQRYIAQAGQQTAQVMEKAEAQRIEFDAQKDLRQEKQVQVENKRAQLQREQNQLNAKKQDQQRLLDSTQNDEKRFQALLKEANEQLASFKQFVTVQGGAGILSGQTSCDDWGCYYNQRDSQWGNNVIGNSRDSMAEYGCLVTSMAMVSTHFGKSLNPGQIAGSSAPFWYNTAYMLQGSWTVNGVTMNRTRIGYSLDTLDSILATGNPAVIGIGRGPAHFIVITAKRDGEYVMRDPYTENGKDISFSSKYSLSSISAVDRVTVQ
ncbi:C39 family peptidase [Patescibacteria group bacterium]|nr:C39 family peptidase [Patescibacteria group bacterium]